jgi:hypothetical protein
VVVGPHFRFDHTITWVRFHPDPIFFWPNKPKTLSERGAQAPVDVVDVDALSERGPQAPVDGVDVVKVVLGVK